MSDAGFDIARKFCEEILCEIEENRNRMSNWDLDVLDPDSAAEEEDEYNEPEYVSGEWCT